MLTEIIYFFCAYLNSETLKIKSDTDDRDFYRKKLGSAYSVLIFCIIDGIRHFNVFHLLLMSVHLPCLCALRNPRKKG